MIWLRIKGGDMERTERINLRMTKGMKEGIQSLSEGTTCSSMIEKVFVEYLELKIYIEENAIIDHEKALFGNTDSIRAKIITEHKKQTEAELYKYKRALELVQC